MDIKDKWYHGNISRQEAEKLVKLAKQNGSFVVRASESVKGAYAISLLYLGNVHTYRVLATPDGSFAVQTSDGVQNRKFLSIDELVEEYKSSRNGLVCGLTNPVGRKGNLKPPILPQRNMTQPSAPPLSSVPPTPTAAVEQSVNSCVICMDSMRDTFFEPCGHVCCCLECSESIRACPLCRVKISRKQKAFL